MRLDGFSTELRDLSRLAIDESALIDSYRIRGSSSVCDGRMATPKLIDIHAQLEQYAWQHFLDYESVRKSKSEFKGLDKDDVDFELNLKHLRVFHTEPEYLNLHPTAAKPFTLFKTVFTNNTNRAQEYSFKTERSTESVCLVCREQGYTIGEQAEMTLKTPGEILEFKAGFKHEMSFNKAQESSVSEMLTWGVDSMIVVPARYQTTAELVIEEMSYSGHFVLESRLIGRVTATLVRRRDGAVVMPVTINIVEVFRDLLASAHTSKELKSIVSIDRNTVRLVTKGQCSFQFAMKQRISINEEAITKAEHTQTERTIMVD